MVLRLKNHLKNLGVGDLYGPRKVENIALSFPVPPDSYPLAAHPAIHISPKEAEYVPASLPRNGRRSCPPASSLELNHWLTDFSFVRCLALRFPN